TGIAEVIAAEGLPRMWRRPDAERGGPAREIQARAEAADFAALPGRAETRLAGLFLAIPDLIALGVPDVVAAAGYPPSPTVPALEKHDVPRRSQRTRSVLPFFAEDAATRTLVYANADLSKASQNREVIAFADHWRQVTGHDPALLIFDSKLTTQAVLAELDDREIGFITLRARHPGVTKALAALPPGAWKSMTLGRAAGKPRPVK